MELKTIVIIKGSSPDGFAGQFGIIVILNTLLGGGNEPQTFCKVRVGNKISDWISSDSLELLLK